MARGGGGMGFVFAGKLIIDFSDETVIMNFFYSLEKVLFCFLPSFLLSIGDEFSDFKYHSGFV